MSPCGHSQLRNLSWTNLLEGKIFCVKVPTLKTSSQLARRQCGLKKCYQNARNTFSYAKFTLFPSFDVQAF